MMRSIEKFRVEYGDFPLNEVDDDPLKQFQSWFDDAVRAKIYEPNGMTFSTVGLTGRPSSRIVLLKKLDRKGFHFFTSTLSRKGEQIGHHPVGALTFWWPEIHRQVRIEGFIQEVSRREVTTYFAKRPRGAQIAAHVSIQSNPIDSRESLEAEFQELNKRFKGKKIPCPKTWGGYCLIPDRIEFWQGRTNRLHDRILYVKTDPFWIITRLAP